MTDFVATLVSNPDKPALSDALLSKLAQALPESAKLIRLDRQIAIDVAFSARSQTELDEISAKIRKSLSSEPVDIIIQPTLHRRKSLFVADMDSTMIGQECIDELAAELRVKQKVAKITERAMRGELEFDSALRERVRLLEGLDAMVIPKVISEKITITPGARTLISTLRSQGVYTALVSGGFTLFTSRIGATIGFDEDRANTLMLHNGKLTGEVAEPILGREAKRATLIELREQFALQPEETLAIGDGANDLDMIQEAGLGVAFRAKPAVAAAADARIDHADLTALLYAQGYSRSTWME
ncbi:MAG: phosphoserine phosphatase SerB [Beijerinckiaceae bacterium]|jgi:phosphoserine phosphatase|nr:phosphoserine phosphatase SerB [Beijerinckiaceae bacterium]